MDATGRLARLLALLPWLSAHPGTSLAEAAAQFDLTERQLVADIELLFLCGLPGYLPGDLIDISYEGGVVTVRDDQGLTRPLRLTSDEAVAVVVALRTLATLPGASGSTAVHSALVKLEAAAGEAARAAPQLSVDVDAVPELVAVLDDARARARRVHLRYYVPSRDETTERDVDPMRLVAVEGRAYLEAWCRLVEAVRFFRLDRVVEARVLDVAVDLPPEAAPRDLDQGLYQPGTDDPVVELRLAPAAAWVADYYPCEEVDRAGDGSLRVRLRVSDPRWVRRLVLQLGGAAEVQAPAELAAAVRTDAAAALSAYPA